MFTSVNHTVLFYTVAVEPTCCWSCQLWALGSVSETVLCMGCEHLYEQQEHHKPNLHISAEISPSPQRPDNVSETEYDILSHFCLSFSYAELFQGCQTQLPHRFATPSSCSGWCSLALCFKTHVKHTWCTKSSISLTSERLCWKDIFAFFRTLIAKQPSSSGELRAQNGLLHCFFLAWGTIIA